MADVYLETSFVSAHVTQRNDAASIYRRGATREWWTAQRHKHDLYVSQEVITELSHPDFRHRDAALELISSITVLPITPEVEGLAKLLVAEHVMPSPVGGDAVHTAVATVHRIDYMLSWNVRHLANPNKLRHLQTICLRLGLTPPTILTPDLLWELDDE